MAAIEHEGIACVRVEFDNSHELESNAKDFDPVQGGVLLLDPNRYWCVRGCELRNRYIDAEALINEKVQLRDPSENLPVPKQIVSVSNQKRSMGEHLVVKTMMEFELYEPSRLPPDKEFSLSAFGLPEPLGVSWSRTPWYLWVGLAGILFLLVGAGFYWLKRRRQAAGS
jgi:LPXTG-motif cell wall-anchored protein